MSHSVGHVTSLIDQLISQETKNDVIIAAHNDMVMEGDSAASQIGIWSAEVSDYHFGAASSLLTAILDAKVNPTDAYFYVDESDTLRTFNKLSDLQSPVDTQKLAEWLVENESSTEYMAELSQKTI